MPSNVSAPSLTQESERMRMHFRPRNFNSTLPYLKGNTHGSGDGVPPNVGTVRAQF